MLEMLERLERLKEFVASIDEEIWNKPIAPGKWTVKDIIAHLWHWDVYTLNVMLPQMQDSAVLPEFPDHDEHNAAATELGKTFQDKASLLSIFAETRSLLVNRFRNVDHPHMRFTIGDDDRPYSLDRYLHIFAQHDEHHRKQIEALKSRRGQDGE